MESPRDWTEWKLLYFAGSTTLVGPHFWRLVFAQKVYHFGGTIPSHQEGIVFVGLRLSIIAVYVGVVLIHFVMAMMRCNLKRPLLFWMMKLLCDVLMWFAPTRRVVETWHWYWICLMIFDVDDFWLLGIMSKIQGKLCPFFPRNFRKKN